MTALRVWFARVAGLFRRSARDRALDAELRAHLADLTDDLVDRGRSRADAEAEARRTFGGVDQVKEACRDQRGWPLVDSLRQDVHTARRVLAAHPGSTLLIVAGLGLGIGVSMGFFTIVNAICLRGLPIPQPDRVQFMTSRDRDGKAGGLSYADFEDLRQAAPAFAGVAAYTPTALSLADERGAPQRVSGCYVSASAFELLGTRPAAGRTFQPGDDRPGAAPVAILGEAIWASRYRRDPSIIGRSVRINGVDAVIVGVMPNGFRFPERANLWLPLAALPGLTDQPATARSLAVFGRLNETASPADAGAQVAALGARVAAQESDGQDVRFESVPINDHFNGRITDPVWLAFLTAGLLVLLVACANVANVLLARLARRSREVALRIALGATRLRVVRQLLIESLCLAALGGVAGLTFAMAAVRLLAWSYPASSPLPYWIEFTVDGRVLAALVAVCSASVLVFGLVPAVHSARHGVNDAIRDGGRQGTSGRRTRWLTATFLALELALTIVLLANISMSVGRERDRPGFEVDPTLLLTARVTLPPQQYPSDEARQQFYDRLTERIARVGAVTSMTWSLQMPPGHQPRHLRLPDDARPPGVSGPVAYSTPVGPRFFETLGVPLAEGRDVSAEDALPGHEAVVVNQQFARTFLGGRHVLGERIALEDRNAPDTAPVWRVVVGVIPNLRDGGLPPPIAYVPTDLSQSASAAVLFRLRTAGAVEAASDAVRQAVAGLDRDLPLYHVQPLADALRESNFNGRISADILTTISSIAFLLAVIGLYAVTAQSVTQRTAEIGIRVALGASSRSVVWLVVRRTLAYVLIGLAAGILCTVAFEGLFVSATDTHRLASVSTLAPVAGVVLLVALIAAAQPAARASRIEPSRALRQE